MWYFTLLVLTIGQAAPAAPAVLPPIFAGEWAIMANSQPGAFTLGTAKKNQIYGNMFDGFWTGTFDPATRRVEFMRRQLGQNGESYDVQAYKGELTANTDAKPPVYIMKGTFKTVAGPGWGAPGVEYAWRADAIIHPSRAEEFARLQGEWVVLGARTTAFTHSTVPDEVPDETHLTQVGTSFTIRGNALLRDGKLVATLANDLLMPGAAKDIGMCRRHPLLLSLPDGKAVLCAYAISGEQLEIVYPHTVERLRGQFISLKRK